MFGDDRMEDLRELRILLERVGGGRDFGCGPQRERWCWRVGAQQREQVRGRVLRIWDYVDMGIVGEGGQSSEESQRIEVFLSALVQSSSSKWYSKHREDLSTVNYI